MPLLNLLFVAGRCDRLMIENMESLNQVRNLNLQNFIEFIPILTQKLYFCPNFFNGFQLYPEVFHAQGQNLLLLI